MNENKLLSGCQILGLLKKEEEKYYDKKSNLSRQEYFDKLKNSCTIYVGNLSFFTTEEQLLAIFSKCGNVKELHMGLNKINKSPCGFCLIEFYSHEMAKRAVLNLNLKKIEDRQIHVDWDIGYSQGREYGRGYEGGQRRDEKHRINDSARPRFNQSRDRERNWHPGRRGGYRGGHGGGGRYSRGYRRDHEEDEENEEEGKRGKLYSRWNPRQDEDRAQWKRSRSRSREREREGEDDN